VTIQLLAKLSQGIDKVWWWCSWVQRASLDKKKERKKEYQGCATTPI
jgi:hypothetical protein